jgi:hypothetical protein
VGIPLYKIGDKYKKIFVPYLLSAQFKIIYMKKNIAVVLVFSAAVACFTSCKKEKENTPAQAVTVFAASGDISASITAFKNLIGGALNTTPGAVGGRREVNWDGVDDSLVGKPLPDDFFNAVLQDAPAGRKRGLTYASAGGTFMVSNSNFANINAAAADQFRAFSGNKTFANINSNRWEVQFRVPGQTTLAAVKGFGMVFSDVDLTNSTSLEFFNGTTSLGKYFVQPHDAATSFSFAGVYFNNGESITGVVVSHQGNLASGANDVSNNGTADLVLLDDFIYSEPVAR